MLATGSALWLSACVVAPYGYNGGYNDGYGPRGPAPQAYDAPVAMAPMAPPAPYVEVVPVMPFAGAVWIGGYWNWVGGRHVWVGGRWDHPRQGYRWEPHRWEPQGGNWHLRGSGWRQAR